VTVLVAIRHLPASVVLDAREACKAVGLPAADWTGGVPTVAACAAITGLEPGARRIPDDAIALLDATPGLQLVLCAQEPLVKPRVVIGDGRICVLGPPIGRGELIGALRAALQTPPIAIAHPLNQRFEVLRKSHWIAWTRGGSGPAISLHEQRGATVVIGDGSIDRSEIADAMTSSQSDADRESALGAVAGDAGVVHLIDDASAWLLYWPAVHCPLWLCSPHRVPARWDAARGIASVAGRRLLRLPAFPADQLIAAWSEAAIARDALAPVHRLAPDGGSQTLLGLDDLAGEHPEVTGLVVEVR
jgi:hypothetical protein